MLCVRNAVIGALKSRRDLPMPVENLLLPQPSLSCSSHLLTQCDTICHSTAVTVTTAADTASETVDVSDISVTLPVPVSTVSSLSSAVDNNQTVSSLVSIRMFSYKFCISVSGLTTQCSNDGVCYRELRTKLKDLMSITMPVQTS